MSENFLTPSAIIFFIEIEIVTFSIYNIFLDLKEVFCIDIFC